MELTPASVPWQTVNKLMTGSILPRPIGWISTVNANGQPNLAPFSFFNMVCANPPTVMFASMIRSTDGGQKDTLNNIRVNGEYVVNIVTEELAEAMNISSQEISSDVNEFELAGVTPVASATISPPRVAESPIHLECKMTHIIEIGNQPGGGSVVIGEVVHLHVDEGVLLGTDKIDLTTLRPIGRLAGGDYVRMRDIFHMERPKSQIAKKEGSQHA
jgi:flavin reductase (DIM6/NTAB) family NADH-FMN oxidoreductase RutF